MTAKDFRYFALGLVGVALLAVVSLGVGAADMSLSALVSGGADAQATKILMISRIPRTLALILAGSSLAVAGLLIQILVRNRFVDTSTTGTTEAATLGFLVATILAPGWPVMGKMLIATAFALAGTMLFLRILRAVPLRDVVLAPLVGIMLSGVIGAAATFLAYRYDLMASLLAWRLGDFSAVLRGRYELLWFGLPAAVAAYVAADRFTVVGMGKSFAVGLGLNYRQSLALGLTIVSVVAAVCLVSVGAIPFLGLIVPNLVSLMVGDNMRRTLPWVALCGAAAVLACDILGRLIRFPYEIPIGVVVGVIGSGVFLWLLTRRRTDAA